jgi:hypothetical protein
MSIHHCHARDCHTPVAPRFLMCRKHWRMVPPVLQGAVWATYRKGQEIDKHPSRAYIEAARAAILAVYQRECPHETLTEVKRDILSADWAIRVVQCDRCGKNTTETRRSSLTGA